MQNAYLEEIHMHTKIFKSPFVQLQNRIHVSELYVDEVTVPGMFVVLMQSLGFTIYIKDLLQTKFK